MNPAKFPAMKKIMLALMLLTATFAAPAQTCEEREAKLLETAGAFSAGYLYNTYGMIGAIADGYVKDAYNTTTVRDIMKAQQQLADNITGMIQKMVTNNILKDEADVTYMKECMTIMKGLKTQAQYLIDYAETGKADRQNAYAEQRDKNWKAISKLMGVEDEE